MTTPLKSVGVIVARFQVGDLHSGHRALISHVQKCHEKILIVLGIAATYATDHDPLPYNMREKMVAKEFPTVLIAPLTDMRSNEDWSVALDNLIASIFPDKTAILYGSRDSFRESYSGKFETKFFPESSRHSGTSVRERIMNKPGHASAFRRGVIFAHMNRPAHTYATVDIAVYCYNTDPHRPSIQVLMGRKPHDPPGQYRLIGGFVDPTDSSYEESIAREKNEESGDYAIGPLEYVCSRRIDDWRYRGTKDSIMTTFFRAQYLFGYFEPKDDISELKWIDLEVMQSILVPEHHPLGEKLYSTFSAKRQELQQQSIAA